VRLAQKRSTTYWDRFFAAFSTPTVKGLSRIEKGYTSGDQREYYVPCPHCGHMQTLCWEQLDFSGRGTREEPVYICGECAEAIAHDKKLLMLARGEWRSGADFRGIRSYYINELYSPWSTWEKIVDDFLQAKEIGAHAIRTWRNTSLGMPYEEAGDSFEAALIQERAESVSTADSGDTLLPEGVLVLTAGVDVQHDRLAVEIVGWGYGDESWSLEYTEIHGSTKHAKVWEELDDRIVQRRMQSEAGVTLGIPIIGIDSSDGVTSEQVFAFCRERRRGGRFGCLPFKGSSVFDAQPFTKPTKAKTKLENPWIIGVSQIKLRIYDALRIAEPGPGYMHFPEGRPPSYYKGLTAEKLVTAHNKAGWPRREWHKIYERNEPLDCRVYAYAALKILNPDYDAIAAKRASMHGNGEEEEGTAARAKSAKGRKNRQNASQTGNNRRKMRIRVGV